MKSLRKQAGALLLTVTLASLFFLLLYYCDNKYKQNGIQPAEGLLVLSESSLEEHPVSHLAKGWAFYPDVLLSPDDFTNGAPDQYMYYTDIGEHTRFDSTGNSSDPHGSGSYVLNLRLPSETKTYALELPEVFSASTLYIGNRPVMELGEPAPENYTPQTKSSMVTFDASGNTTIILAVSDYSHYYSGMIYPPAFGTTDGVSLIRELRLGLALFLAVLDLLAGALALYFGLHMKHKDALLFSILCIVMCCFTSYSLLHSAIALPVFPWHTLELLSGTLMTLLVLILHNRICSMDSYSKRISTGCAVLFCILTLIYGLFSARLTVPLMQTYSVLTAIYKAAAAGYLLITSVLSMKDRNEAATPVYYASIIYAAAFVWDRILPGYEPVLGGWYQEWGSIALTVAIGYTFWRDITGAYANSLAFTEEHRQMTRQLSMQTEYVRQLHQSSEENRRLTHDFRQHLRTITGIAARLSQEEEADRTHQELLAYLEQIVQDISLPQLTETGDFCQNIALDALLQYYSSITNDACIRTKFSLLLPEQLPLTDVELCTVIGNLLENAVDACYRLPKEERFITLQTKLLDNALLLLVENSYDGVFSRSGRGFRSRKNGGMCTGIGLESIRNIVERSGGTLDLYPKETMFRAGVSLPLYSHH